MATKRTDEFDAFMAQQEQRAADIKAVRQMTPHSTLKGMGKAMAPLQTPPVGTMPPPVAMPDVEVLVAAETQVTSNPLFLKDEIREDEIELIEESGLLMLEPDQQADVDAIEVSSSFLIEDLDGSPDFMRAEDLPDLSDLTEDVEELAPVRLTSSEALAPSYNGRGEVVELARPRLPEPRQQSVAMPVMQRSGLYNESVDYSDGVPRISARAPGLSSKTLRVSPPRSPKSSGWLRNAAIGTIFLAGIGAGIGFALHGNSSTKAQPAAALATESTPTPAPDLAPVAVAAIAAEEVAREPEVNAEAEVIAEAQAPLPTVMPLDPEEAAKALAMPAEPVPVEIAGETSDEAGTETEPAIKAEPAAKIETKAKPKTATKTDTRSAPKATEKKRHKAAAMNALPDAAAADPGVLMLAAKPPSAIRIDGKATGLTTPQRVLKLAPGKHRITLLNQEHGIRDSFKVSIVSGQKTRIVRDNTSKIK